MRIPVSFLHTSPAAIPPLMQFYGSEAPDLEITNQLDDGLLRLLAKGDAATAERRLQSMLSAAQDVYGARLIMVTCSSVTSAIISSLAASTHVPVFKIDDAMANEAVQTSGRLGVAITFPPTLEPTTRLLRSAAERAGTTLSLEPLIVDGAYDALLGGKPDLHDTLLLEGIDEFAASGVDGIVLAQVSMARLLPILSTRVRIPVYSSLPSSLKHMRHLLA